MMNFFRKRLNKKGFTLVELLIVIAVLGIIAGIGVTAMSGVTDTFKKKADAETAKQLARQIEIQVLAGEETIASAGTTFDTTNLPKGVTFPTPQSGGTFSITVSGTGGVTASAGTAADAIALDMDGYTIQVSAVE